MAKRKKRRRRVIKFNAPFNINVGIVVFGLIMIYILINTVIFFTTEKTKYETVRHLPFSF